MASFPMALLLKKHWCLHKTGGSSYSLMSWKRNRASIQIMHTLLHTHYTAYWLVPPPPYTYICTHLLTCIQQHIRTSLGKKKKKVITFGKNFCDLQYCAEVLRYTSFCFQRPSRLVLFCLVLCICKVVDLTNTPLMETLKTRCLSNGVIRTNDHAFCRRDTQNQLIVLYPHNYLS